LPRGCFKRPATIPDSACCASRHTHIGGIPKRVATSVLLACPSRIPRIATPALWVASCSSTLADSQSACTDTAALFGTLKCGVRFYDQHTSQ